MKTKVIKAWWWRDKVNLGDVLTPYIVENLSGLKCQHIGRRWTKAIEYFLKHIKARKKINWDILKPIYFFEPEYILGVGSILNHYNNRNAIVWGSGFIKENNEFTGKRICAVRGKYSSDRLFKLGYGRVDTLGDPALLLPLIYKSKVSRKKKIAIVPNFSEFEKFKSLYGKKFDVIDMNTDDIESTINFLCSYNYILSTSLHGLIICHAYGVPAIWIEDTVLVGDTFHFKYRDYFSSVGIDYYEPYREIDEIINGDVSVFFEKNKEKYTIKEDLHFLQQKLLKAAPFPVISKYLD